MKKTIKLYILLLLIRFTNQTGFTAGQVKNEKAKNMTTSQRSLVSELTSILADGAKNTHQIAKARGDFQAYESSLRDRLFRLADKGVVLFENTTRGRFWSLAK